MEAQVEGIVKGTHLCTLEETLEDLGHLWSVVQEQETLADAHPVGFLDTLIQFDEQPQDLRNDAFAYLVQTQVVLCNKEGLSGHYTSVDSQLRLRLTWKRKSLLATSLWQTRRAYRRMATVSGALCTASSSLSRRLLSSAMPTPCSYWPS